METSIAWIGPIATRLVASLSGVLPNWFLVRAMAVLHGDLGLCSYSRTPTVGQPRSLRSRALRLTATAIRATSTRRSRPPPGSSIVSYDWDFGDDHTGTGKSPSHEFEPGTYQVTLTVKAASGAETSTSTTVTIERINQPPKAVIAIDCELLACTFDGSDSDDPDGSITAYAWDVNGEAEGDEDSIQHTFSTPGEKSVTLEVTDNDGVKRSVTKEFTVTDTAGATVAFVGAASTNGNRTSHPVTIPSTVQAGDRLVLFMSTNSDTSTITGPAGWTSVRAVSSSGFRSQAWTKVATSADAGATVRATTSAIAKGDISVAAYRASEGTPAITAEAARTVSASSSLTSPAVDVDSDNAWLVTYWGIKSSGAVELDIPGANEVRASSDGAGSGRIAAYLADSDQAVDPPEAGEVAATLGVSATRAAIFSVVLSAE